jgi:hypothetical protein
MQPSALPEFADDKKRTLGNTHARAGLGRSLAPALGLECRMCDEHAFSLSHATDDRPQHEAGKRQKTNHDVAIIPSASLGGSGKSYVGLGRVRQIGGVRECSCYLLQVLLVSRNNVYWAMACMS